MDGLLEGKPVGITFHSRLKQNPNFPELEFVVGSRYGGGSKLNSLGLLPKSLCSSLV